MNIVKTVLKQVREFASLECFSMSEGNLVREIKTRIAKAAIVQARLKLVWKDISALLATTVKLLCPLVLSVLLCAAEPWTLNAEIEKKNMHFSNDRHLLQVHWSSHTATAEVHRRVHVLIGDHDSFLMQMKKKWKWFANKVRAKRTVKCDPASQS